MVRQNKKFNFKSWMAQKDNFVSFALLLQFEPSVER